jgi:putative ABC transport system permease protein
VLLALGGGLLGLLVARCGVAALVTFAPDGLPRAAEIGVHPWAFAFTSALALCTGVAFGLAPALVAARVPLHETLKAGAGAGGGRPGGVGGRARLPSALVVAEVTIALILLAGAGLLIRSFVLLQKVDRGFRPEGAVSFSLSLPPHHYGSDARLAAFAAEATARLAALPGVEAVGASQALPFSVQLNIVYFEIVGRPPVTDWPTTHVFEVTPGYFRAMGIPLVRGRLFDARDSADAPRVAIINESLARRFFPGEDPIGKRVRDPTRPSTAFADIVGVVADVKDGLVYKLDGGGAAMQSYVPFAQNTYDVLTFVLRTRGPSAGLAGAVRAAIRELDPDHPVAGLRPLDELVAASVARQRFAMFLFAVFSAVALVLAAVGIYGVMAYTVARRTGEIGIRIALGAEARDVVRLVLLQGARLVAFGIGLGLGGALLLTRLLGALLFGVAPHDPLTFGATAALLSGVAALACLLPARRATRIDPMTALRAE